MVIPLLFIIIIAFKYRSPSLLFSWSHRLSLFLISCSVSVFVDFFSFCMASAIVRQTVSPLIHISRSISRFVWFCGQTDGPPTASPLTLSLSDASLFLFLHWIHQPGSRLDRRLASFYFHHATCSNPATSTSLHRLLRIFFAKNIASILPLLVGVTRLSCGASAS